MENYSPSYRTISECGLFSAQWYLDQHQDVAATGQDPLVHYLSYGAEEGRDPGPEFSTRGYLARYPDVADAGINPLLHYIRYGQKEGRLTTPCLDPEAIKRPYHNFSEFLSYSILAPLMKAPFSNVDSDIFALMDQVAQWLCLKQAECKAKPLVSVIMPMRDRANVVGESIQSVLDQSYENYELIVVDDGSQDDSVSVVRAFADARIRLFESGSSAGVSAARNKGLAEARGELIAYLDSDNTWRPDYLRAMVGAFQVKGEADAIYGGQYLYRGNENDPFAMRFGSYNPSLLSNHNYIDLNCFVHRRQILNAIGDGFCEEIRRWVDWELILRISRVGRIYSVPILQSNYFLDKTDNTITAIEALEPAREKIRAQWGYGSQIRIQRNGGQLSNKVTVIVPGHGGLDNLGPCVRSLAECICHPLVQMLVVADVSHPEAVSGISDFEIAGGETIFSESGFDLFDAVGRAENVVDPGSDLLILDPNATLSPGSLPLLQNAAYEDDSIAMVVPQQVMSGGDSVINSHVPYAFNDVPCDVTLSNHYRNVEALPLFNGGGPIDLNFASFFCIYIKRQIWDLCGGSDAGQRCHYQSDRIMCEFVRHVLGKRIVYIPDAVALHQNPAELNKCII